jgi:hypothetical protein
MAPPTWPLFGLRLVTPRVVLRYADDSDVLALAELASLGVHDPAWPRELIYVDDEYQYRDNPRVARNENALHKALMRGAAWASGTWLLAGLPYLVIGLLAAPRAWRRRVELPGSIALILLGSAWLYLLPLIMLVAAELRYLGWSCLASVLAFAIVWLVPSSVRDAAC